MHRTFRKSEAPEQQEYRIDYRFDTITQYGLYYPNPFSAGREFFVAPPKRKEPLTRKPLYTVPRFPSSIYLEEQRLQKQSKPVYGYYFYFDRMDEFFGFEQPTKVVRKQKSGQSELSAQKTFITEPDQQYEEKTQDALLVEADKIYSQYIRMLKKQVKFNPEIARLEALSLYKELQAAKDQAEAIFRLENQKAKTGYMNANIEAYRADKQLQLDSLEAIRRSLEQYFISVHEQLYQAEQQRQQNSDLQPLFAVLYRDFPGQNPIDVLLRIDALEGLTHSIAERTDGTCDRIKNEEQRQEVAYLQALQDKYAADLRDKQEIYGLVVQIDELSRQNYEKSQDVLKAQEIQARYLYLCYNITAFYIKYGRIFGGDLPDFIVPSVNSPVEVLRAMDTMFCVAFPEAEKAQRNFKKINGNATHVWQKLLAMQATPVDQKRETVAMLAKARYLVACSAAEEKELYGMKQRLQIYKETILDELSSKWTAIGELIAQIRRFGENCAVRWDLAAFSSCDKELKRRYIYYLYSSLKAECEEGFDFYVG